MKTNIGIGDIYTTKECSRKNSHDKKEHNLLKLD